jgi:arylsulfatase B
MKTLVLLPFLFLIFACSGGQSPPEAAMNVDDPAADASSTPPSNILLIIGDDMGVETLASYGLSENPPKTTTLDQLAKEGVQFTNFWSQPVCSPTRATMLTGRYAFRTGVGRPGGEGDSKGDFPAIPDRPESAPYETPRGTGGPPGNNRALPPDEYTLPLAFRANEELGYATAAIGKWHLADKYNGWEEHPTKVGFDYFSGLILGWPESYFSWNKVENGKLAGTTGYTPDDKVEDALEWIDAQGDRPWFLWYAFNLPHDPVHLPPENLWQTDHSNIDPQAEIGANSQQAFSAMMEAMDTEISKLLASLAPEVRDNTYVIFMGDNGTDRDYVTAPFRPTSAKGSVYQGGVNVPLIVTGPGVSQGAVTDAMVNSTDVFSTIIEMAGISVDEVVPEGVTIDSVSFLPYLSDPDAESRREWLYADYFNDNFAGVETANYAMRNQRYKLLRSKGVEEFYDLSEDPYEHNNLLTGELSEPVQAEYRNLQQQLLKLRSSK